MRSKRLAAWGGRREDAVCESSNTYFPIKMLAATAAPKQFAFPTSSVDVIQFKGSFVEGIAEEDTAEAARGIAKSRVLPSHMSSNAAEHLEQGKFGQEAEGGREGGREATFNLLWVAAAAVAAVAVAAAAAAAVLPIPHHGHWQNFHSFPPQVSMQRKDCRSFRATFPFAHFCQS